MNQRQRPVNYLTKLAAFLMASGIAVYPALFMFFWLDTSKTHVVTQLIFFLVLLLAYRTIIGKFRNS